MMATLLGIAPVQAEPAFDPGAAVFPMEDRGRIIARALKSDPKVPYYFYVPRFVRPGARPLVTVHGISRNAVQHLASFAPFAEETGRIVIAPLFTEAHCRRYQQVVVGDCRADDALGAVLEEVAAETAVSVDKIDLFGFSGGAQFAHRFAMLYPDRVERLALASAGWYTFPTTDDSFPYGLAPGKKNARYMRNALEGFLQIPTLVMVGEWDVERDSGLRKNRIVDRRQGLTRVERAARWTSAVRKVAAEQGVRPEIRFETIDGCGHSFNDCVEWGGMVKKAVDWFEQSP